MSFWKKLLFGKEIHDLPLPPRTYRDLLLVSLWCDTTSFMRVVQAYDAIFANSGRVKVHRLNELAEQSSYRYWQQIFPFIPSLFWGILTRPISSEEAALISCVGIQFLYDGTLGISTDERAEMVFFQIKPTRRCDIFPPFAPIGRVPDLRLAAAAMKPYGWKIERFKTDIEQVKNEKKSFTFRWMLRQITLEDSGKGQPWYRFMWNVWII